MLTRTAAVVLLVCALADVAGAQTAFDRIQQQYTQYMDANDPLAFPVKVHALAGNSYKFWRGSKDLFYAWCDENTKDWLADKHGWLTSHGDIHFGNIGSYAAGKFGELGFGLVDFDESCRTPGQMEMMQGWITLRLTARHNQLLVTETQQDELYQILIDAYRQGLTANESAGEQLAGDPHVKRLLKDTGKSYAKGELNKLSDGKFPAATFWKDGDLKGQVRDIYRPAMSRANEFAAGIEQAIRNSSELGDSLKLSTRQEIRAAMKHAVQRTRAGSSGSQGLKKYLILLEKPLKGQDHDLVMYLKQEIPSSAERAGVSPKDSRSPGQRVSTVFASMSDPKPLMNSWCEIGNESYWVTFKEPWSDELEPEDFATYDDLKAGARIWGIATAASHRNDQNAAKFAEKLTGEQISLIRKRSDAYLQQLESDFLDFSRDGRVVDLRKKAIQAIAEAGKQR